LGHQRTIRINRAPVLALWGAVVAERLGFDPDAALNTELRRSIGAETQKCRHKGRLGDVLAAKLTSPAVEKSQRQNFRR
jgi:hypothetical protein